jgi:hypothetical protein
MTFDLESRREGVRLVIKLYDSRGKIKAEDENLNKLRTRLATVKSACFAKLPPCEATFKQQFKFSSSALIFPFESYSFITSLRAAVSDISTSQPARFDRSLKLSTVKSTYFAKLPPYEATFKQHVLRASLQTYVWYCAILQSPLIKSRLQFGWEKDMDHSFLSTFKVKCHLTFYKILSMQDNPCSKQTQPLEQTALPLQVQIRSCKKSDDI